MYFSGTFKSFSIWILSFLMFSTKCFWADQFYWSFLFSISFSFFVCSMSYSLPLICFFSSFACFFKSYFLSFSNFYSRSFSSLCFLTAASNSAFSALVCSSSLRYFSNCCSRRASWSYLAFFCPDFGLKSVLLSCTSLVSLNSSLGSKCIQFWLSIWGFFLKFSQSLDLHFLLIFDTMQFCLNLGLFLSLLLYVLGNLLILLFFLDLPLFNY